eukprot:4265002-Amphidinium_carterae.1
MPAIDDQLLTREELLTFHQVWKSIPVVNGSKCPASRSVTTSTVVVMVTFSSQSVNKVHVLFALQIALTRQ